MCVTDSIIRRRSEKEGDLIKVEILLKPVSLGTIGVLNRRLVNEVHIEGELKPHSQKETDTETGVPLV